MIRRAGRRHVDAALVYASRGWPVFPCHSPGKNGSCSCHQPDCCSPGKHPRVHIGFNAATTDREQIRRWWSRWPDANVAIRTGAPSGLVVIDIDPDHGGDESLDRPSARFGDLPSSRLVRTGSGGRHLYFSHPGTTVRNDAGRRLGRGLDVRGDGGYVIAPPSRHPSGGTYRLEANSNLLPALPDWVLELLHRSPSARSPSPRPAARQVDSDAWTRAAINGELHRLRTAAPGTRNDTLNRISFRLGQIVGTGRLDEATAERLLLDGALFVGLGEREAISTMHSGLRAGYQSRLQDTGPEIE